LSFGIFVTAIGIFVPSSQGAVFEPGARVHLSIACVAATMEAAKGQPVCKSWRIAEARDSRLELPELAQLRPLPVMGSLSTEASTGAVGANPAGTTAETAGVVVASARRVVSTTVDVTGKVLATDSNEGYERRITAREVEASAGTFGDPSRFMQTLPGVVMDNDQRNDFIVRGGNPAETLFVIDNIQIPSINQLAMSDTTGGFVSMIDEAAVQHMTLHTDAYDSKFDQRLSAVLEISTRPEGQVGYHMRSEFGIGGAGGSMTRPLGKDGSLFVSARRSVLNLFTNDIGMNGVPIYNNGLVRADGRIDAKNNWWGLSLTGIDSMAIHPSHGDAAETNPFDITYSGWRNTTGANWQHVFSAKSFGVVSASNSEQQQTTNESAQMLENAQVYYENSHDGITTLKYDWTYAAKHWLTWTAGGQTSVDRLNYDVQQPIGLPNPYTADPTPGDATSINRVFTAASSAAYGQAAIMLPHGMKVVAGERVSQWAIVGRTVATGKVVFSAPVLGKTVHVGYAEYAQLPPALYLLAFSNQHGLTPIRSRHVTAGVNLLDTPRARISVEGYQKRYSDYPVAVNFPQLTMANIADTFGQAFLMFPMTSQGLGVARGAELAVDVRPLRRLTLSSSLSYMRSWYSGLDGVLHKGNYDLPVVGNVSGNALLGKGWTASFRYSGSSGKPYTPDNYALSLEQGRDVYDLTQLNSQRAPDYSRLDFRAEWTHPMKRGTMMLHVGLDNALGTSNFYSNLWMPQYKGTVNGQLSYSGPVIGGTQEQTQMPRFPDGGMKYTF
jgi:hypothetical protein